MLQYQVELRNGGIVGGRSATCQRAAGGARRAFPVECLPPRPAAACRRRHHPKQRETVRYNRFCDKTLIALDQAMACLFASLAEDADPPPAPHPGAHCREARLSARERRRSKALMRVNHAGEMAAQGLYLGQAQMAQGAAVRSQMRRAGREESRHLSWCRQRLKELGGRNSVLDPAWFLGAWLIGLAAGRAGEAWSLGFLEETEQQVVRHLDRHLRGLPESDQRSRAILERMKEEESEHARKASSAGARALPRWLRAGMFLSARVMTGVSRHL